MKIKQYVAITILSLSLALFFRLFILTTYRVPTGSMQPTLKPGDFIVATPLSFGWSSPFSGNLWTWAQPQKGDVVVFSYPDQNDVNYVKRVVATGGDTIEIKNETLYINGIASIYSADEDQSDSPDAYGFKVVREKWQDQERRLIVSTSQKSAVFGPLTLGPDELFLLGDNRDASDDSRNWGAVPKSMVKSKVLQIWLSLDWQSKWAQNRLPKVRWERMFRRVH